MPAPYTIPVMENITSPLIATNDLTGGYGGLMLSMTVFIIITITIAGQRNSSIIDGLMFASIISIIVNLLLVPIGITSPVVLSIFIVIMVATLFLSMMEKKG